MILLALLAFSWTPLDHGPRPPQRGPLHDPPFFVGEMHHLVPQEQLPFSPIETATPVVDQAQTRLYAGTRDGKVRCRFRGETAWVFQAGGAILASPLIEGETLYVPGGDGVVYALNRFTGALRWQVDIHEELTTTPATTEGRLLVMSSSQSVTALDLATGKRLWKFHRDAPGGFTIRGDAQPHAAHGSVYAAASAKAGIVALDANSGEPAWTYALAGANHVLVDGARVIGGGRGELVALDRVSGKKLWTLQLKGDGYPTQPVAMRGLLLVAQDRGALMGVDVKTGHARGAFDPGSGFSQPAFALPGIAYIVSNGGALYSLGLLP